MTAPKKPKLAETACTGRFEDMLNLTSLRLHLCMRWDIPELNRCLFHNLQTVPSNVYLKYRRPSESLDIEDVLNRGVDINMKQTLT